LLKTSEILLISALRRFASTLKSVPLAAEAAESSTLAVLSVMSIDLIRLRIVIF